MAENINEGASCMIRKLTREEIIDTYNQHLVTDFPEDEVKPLAIILDFYDHHRYECYGLFQGDKMLAYAYFADFKAENIDAYLITMLSLKLRVTKGLAVNYSMNYCQL